MLKSTLKALFSPPETGPKILLVDIETAPILGYVWSLWEQNVALNQIHSDWHLLSWSAKWKGTPDDEVMYMDQRNAPTIEDDREILEAIWHLLDQADIVVWQNGKKFDSKKLNARFILNGMRPPSHYRQVDTMEIAKRRFGFTSNKLEYMTSKLCKKHKKLTHKKYPGFELWRACMHGDINAFDEMRSYNIEDVLSMEELYDILRPWADNHPNVDIYREDHERVCSCGSKEFHKRGFHFTNTGKFQTYRCNKCGAYHKDSVNLLSKEKRKSLGRNIV